MLTITPRVITSNAEEEEVTGMTHPGKKNLAGKSGFDSRPTAEEANILPLGYHGPLRWPCGEASASRAEDPGFESRLRWDFFGVKSYQ